MVTILALLVTFIVAAFAHAMFYFFIPAGSAML
jgi:hypothetical protein